MDAHLFRLLMARLAPLLTGSRIEKIQESAPGHLNLALYGAGKKYNFCLRFGRQHPFCFTTAARPPALPKPSAMVMRLRKYLGGKRIISVVPQVWQRKLWLMAGAGYENAAFGKSVWLCLDLAEGAKLCFLNEDEFPEPDHITWPDPAGIKDAAAEWQNWPSLTPALRKTIAALDDMDAAALAADLEPGAGDVFFYAGAAGRIEKISAWPLPAALRGNLQEHASDDILEVFEKAGQDMVLQGLYEAGEKAGQLAGQRKTAKIKKALNKLAEDEKRLFAMTELEKKACLLSANLWRLEAAAKLAEVTVADGDESCKISLDQRYSISENMERMFHAVRRGKRGLKMLAQRRENLEADLAQNELQTVPEQQHKEAAAGKTPVAVNRHVQTFISSDGFRLLVGRDAKGNNMVRKMASGHDLWVHVKEGPGAHVVIKRPHGACEPPLAALMEAGGIAAQKSWLAEAGQAEVMFAEVRHVKGISSGPAGKVSIDRLWRVMTVPVKNAGD